MLLEAGALVDNDHCEPLAFTINNWTHQWGHHNQDETEIVSMLVARAPQAKLENELNTIAPDKLEDLLDMGMAPEALMPVLGRYTSKKNTVTCL